VFPRTGYFVPACVWSGRWADFESCSRIHACGFRCFCRKVWFRARGAHIYRKSVVSCKRGTHFSEKYGFVQEGHTFLEKVWFRARGAHISWKSLVFCSEILLFRYKKPLRACYCSEVLFLGTKKAPAGMLLLRNATF